MPKLENAVTTKTKLTSAILIALTAVSVIVGLGFIISQFAALLLPGTTDPMGRIVRQPDAKGSQFYPIWKTRYTGGYPAFYQVDGTNMGSQGIILQSKKTEFIQEIANTIPIPRGTSKHDAVQIIMDWMHSPTGGNIQNKTEDNPCEGDHGRLTRTSEDILISRCATGCTDWALAFAALARARGIAASVVDTLSDRWITESKNAGCLMHPTFGHYVNDVYTENGWELVDPTHAIFTKYLNNDFNGFALMRFNAYNPGEKTPPLGYGYRYRVFRRGIDTWDDLMTNAVVWRNAVIAEYGLPSTECP